MSVDSLARALALSSTTPGATAAAANAVSANTSANTANTILGQVQALGGTTGIYANTYATTLPLGVTTIVITTAGATGTNATNYAGGVTGGPAGFAWTYDIVANVATNPKITNPGLSTASTAPTLSFPTGGLTGSPAATATVATLVANQSSYWAASNSSDTLLRYGNSSNSVATYPFGGTQIVQYLRTGVDTAISGTIDKVLFADRNIFDYTRVNDSSQMSAFAGVGTGGVVTTLSGGFVTPLMQVTPGITYSVPFNCVRGIFYSQAGLQLASMTFISIDSFRYTFAVPSGTGIYYAQIQGDKNYMVLGAVSKIDIHQGSRANYKGYEFLETTGVTSLAAKMGKASKPTKANLLSRADILFNYAVSSGQVGLGTGAIAAAAGSNCWSTGLFPVDETRGFSSNLSIVLGSQGVAFYDVNRNYVFSNGNTFTAVTTVGSNIINVTATAGTNAYPLMIGSMVSCDTAGVVPGLATSGSLYITSVPVNGAVTGNYTLSGNVTDATGGSHADMHSGGMMAGVALIPPAGYGAVYAATTLFYYFYNNGTTADNWVITDGPQTIPTTIANPSSPSTSLGFPDLEALFPWFRVPMGALGNSITSGYMNDYFCSKTKADLQLMSAVPASQMHQFLDGVRLAYNGQGRNAVTGNLTGVLTSADFAGIKGIIIGPCGGNEVGYSTSPGIGLNVGGNAGGPRATSYPMGTIGSYLDIVLTTTAASTTITVTQSRGNSGLPAGYVFPSTAPGGLNGRTVSAYGTGGSTGTGGVGTYILDASTGVTTQTGGTLGATITPCDSSPVCYFVVTTTSGSTTITISGIESGIITPGTNGSSFPVGSQLGLAGKIIVSQTGATSVTGATASFATNVMTVTVAGTGSFAVGQTVTALGVAAYTYISSLGTGVGGTGTYNLSTSPGTLTARATTATNAGGNGTYVVNNSTSITTGGPSPAQVGTFYGTLYWLVITKLGSWAPSAIPILVTTLPRYDQTSTNGAASDPANPGNPMNILGYRLSDYIDATIAFAKRYHFPLIDMFYNTPFSVNGPTYMYQTDLLHPLNTIPPSAINTAGTRVYSGTLGSYVNNIQPIVSA